MHKGRLEAFSHAVIAISIAIMGLELKLPLGPTLATLTKLTPVFLIHVLVAIFCLVPDRWIEKTLAPTP